jgi:hypothetical protein
VTVYRCIVFLLLSLFALRLHMFVGLYAVKNMSVRVAWQYNKDGKISTRFNEVEDLIKEMIENIGKIRQNRETNSSAVSEQKRIIEINFSWCSLQCSLISNTYDGNFRYSAMGIVVWPRDSFPELWYSMHSAQRPSSHSRHQTFDDLEICLQCTIRYQ